MNSLIVLGADPGSSGSIALLGDHGCLGFIDMPTIERRGGGTHVCGRILAENLRKVQADYPDAQLLAVIEEVTSRPTDGGSQAIRFGESYGVLRGALGAVGIEFESVAPTTWKHRLSLWRTEKDVARLLAIELYPEVADQLARKKDHNRAEALLIARWARMQNFARAA